MPNLTSIKQITLSFNFLTFQMHNIFIQFSCILNCYEGLLVCVDLSVWFWCPLSVKKYILLFADATK